MDYLKQSLAIYELISNGVDSDPKISVTLHTIGRCLMNMNQLTEALDYLKRSLAIKKQISLGVDSDPKISVTLHKIVCCLTNMNQLTKAFNYLKRSLAIYCMNEYRSVLTQTPRFQKHYTKSVVV